jgi:hypothetical protein
MLRHLVIALAAATLVATTFNPDDALAHHGRHWHREAPYSYHFPYSWDLLTPDPRANRPGYPGGHYRRDCYRAASGRSMCPLHDHSL